MRALCLCLCLAATAGRAETATAAPLGDPGAPGRVVAAHIVSRVGAAGAADDRPKRARRDQGVTLFAVVEVVDGARRVFYSDAGAIVLGRRRIATEPLAGAPALRLAWNRIEPAVATMSNTASGAFRFEPIEYRITPIAAGADRPHLAADVRPTLTPDHGDGVGTMRYQLVVSRGAEAVATPGVDARAGRGAGGLAASVHRVSLRRDDTYLGYLTEMYGQPYIWASAGTSDASHQSERLEGSDCADFVVYGARRMGKSLPYMWTGALPDHARTIARGALGDGGVYLDPRGQPLAFPRPGDLILFPRHVGVVTIDRGRPGVLDVEDLMMHTLFDSPKEQAIGESGYADNPVSVLRWP
jgi:cell wall-associated NlpC family hydrolase